MALRFSFLPVQSTGCFYNNKLESKMIKTINKTILFTPVFWVLFFKLAMFKGPMAYAVEINIEQPKPLWEVGLIPGAIRMPHYRGSDRNVAHRA